MLSTILLSTETCLAFGKRQQASMSYMLQHLRNGWQVDQAILSEEDRVVIIRFGHDWDPTCMVHWQRNDSAKVVVDNICNKLLWVLWISHTFMYMHIVQSFSFF